MFYVNPRRKSSGRNNMWSVMAHAGKWEGLTIKKEGFVIELPPEASKKKLFGGLKKAFEKRVFKNELSVEDAIWLGEHGASVYAA